MNTTGQHILGRVVGVTSALFLLYLLAIALLSSSGARAALPASIPTGAKAQQQGSMEGAPTPTPTATSVDTDTPTPTDTDTPTVMPTDTPTSTPGTCTISFEDVPVGSTFYPYIQCMACQGHHQWLSMRWPRRTL